MSHFTKLCPYSKSECFCVSSTPLGDCRNQFSTQLTAIKKSAEYYIQYMRSGRYELQPRVVQIRSLNSKTVQCPIMGLRFALSKKNKLQKSLPLVHLINAFLKCMVHGTIVDWVWCLYLQCTAPKPQP
jgi:hypothetical protein